MKYVFVSKESLDDAVQYFEKLNCTSPEQLGLFFVFKGLGYNSKDYTIYSKEKENTTRLLYYLSALFDKNNETGKNYTSLFPFSISPVIKKTSFYNGGTPFLKLYGRIKDTIDNTLIDSGKYMKRDELNPDMYKFVPNYIEILSNSFLNGKKISLKMFAAWYFRFSSFPVDDSWVDHPTQQYYEDFTRICCNEIKKVLRLTAEEMKNLFDSEADEIRYSDQKIQGADFRELLNFDAGVNPEIDSTTDSSDLMSFETGFSSDEINDLVKPHGKNITSDKLKELLLDTRQVILAGPPGTGKSYVSNKIRSDFDEVYLLQFHPNLTYEQFIGGNTFSEDGNVHAKAGVFLEFCEKARNNRDKKYLFLIDEINRGNISKIFGETILTLDREYTASLPTTLQAKDGKKISEFSIPKNVYILATMNSADRSIALVDYAIRRRFAFVNFYPNSQVVDYMSDYASLPEIRVGTLMDKLNDKLLEVIGDPDLLLGQSYFMPKWAFNTSTNKYEWSKEVLMKQFNYYIIPIIEEYTYGNRRLLLNILGDNLPNRLSDPDEFMNELLFRFGN